MVWDVTQQLTVRIKLSLLFLTMFFKESKIPGVYARVSKAVDWIMVQAGEGRFCQKPKLKESASSQHNSGTGKKT